MSCRKLLPAALVATALVFGPMVPNASATRSLTCQIQLRLCEADCLWMYGEFGDLLSMCYFGCWIGYHLCGR